MFNARAAKRERGDATQRPRPLYLNSHPAVAKVPPHGVPAPNGIDQPTDPVGGQATGTRARAADRKAPGMLPVAEQPLRWETPPPPRGGRAPGSRSTRPHRYTRLAAALRRRPRDWAVVAEFPNPRDAVQHNASNLATAIRSGQTLAWSPAGTFEATIRRAGDTTVVYARYLGEQ